MSTKESRHEYLVLSRGRRDKDAAKVEIEAAIAKLYEWYDHNVSAGEFKSGSRLGTEMAVVSKSGIATDGPFGEAKEVIGGYWIITALNLDEAAQIAAQNPCVKLGIRCEIRPLEAVRATSDNTVNERPRS